jgi:hypothetical protein
MMDEPNPICPQCGKKSFPVKYFTPQLFPEKQIRGCSDCELALKLAPKRDERTERSFVTYKSVMRNDKENGDEDGADEQVKKSTPYWETERIKAKRMRLSDKREREEHIKECLAMIEED